MTVDEIILFIWTLFRTLSPYLNSGMTVLVINFALKKMGLQIKEKKFKRKMLKSLIWGLVPIFASSFSSLFVQTQLSGFEPLAVFLILLLTYVAASWM